MDNKSLSGEKWKEVNLNAEFTNSIKLEVSNFGRVRNTTRFFSKRILTGSQTNGYKTISLKLFEPRSKAVETRLAYHRKQITLLNKRISNTNKALEGTIKSDKGKRELKSLLNADMELIAGLTTQYRKEFRTDELKRTINKSLLIHKMVAECFCRKPKNALFVIHLDYNKHNNRFDNLKWATQIEVTNHASTNPLVLKAIKKRKGKRAEGAKHYKLTEPKVMVIKKQINNGKALRLIAKQFNVSETQILRIKRKINWANVKPAS